MKFTNECLITTDMVPEFIKASYRCKKMTPAYIVMFAVLFILCIFAVFYDLFTGHLNSMDIAYIAFPLICLCAVCGKISHNIQKEKSVIEKMGEGHRPVINNIKDNGVEVINHTSGRTIFYPYKKIQKMLITDNLYVFETNDNLIIPLKKGGFTKGTDEAFLEYIQTKCKVIGTIKKA